ncbi:hypothetical protein BJY22_001953 [Kribbella shirazensis]|uniref:Uncharacterized protein n=1 Tax=Kribbella shirazensis TaxID=1105143 RepID=A0A7X5V8K3_9ACTN|nr:hypothetical protein [Kribbella shirazensis]
MLRRTFLTGSLTTVALGALHPGRLVLKWPPWTRTSCGC